MNEHMLSRDSCPGCSYPDASILQDIAYSEEPLREHLDSFYAAYEIEHQFLEGARYILAECKRCGLIYQTEVPNDFLANKLYEEWLKAGNASTHDMYKKSHDVNYYAGFAQELINVIKYFNKNPSELKVLDFGTGWGNWCSLAKSFNCDVYGTELSQSHVESLNASGIGMLSWDDIPKYSFDFINTEQVFEHLSNPFDTLMHLKNSLKPNGLIKVSVPNGSSIKKRMETWDWTADRFRPNAAWEHNLNAVAPLQHINCFSHSSLRTMGMRAGLEPVVIPTQVTLKNPRKLSMRSRTKKLVARYYRRLVPPQRTIEKREGLRLYFKTVLTS